MFDGIVPASPSVMVRIPNQKTSAGSSNGSTKDRPYRHPRYLPLELANVEAKGYPLLLIAVQRECKQNCWSGIQKSWVEMFQVLPRSYINALAFSGGRSPWEYCETTPATPGVTAPAQVVNLGGVVCSRLSGVSSTEFFTIDVIPSVIVSSRHSARLLQM